MKFAIFADVHGNYEALNQMFLDTESKNIETYIFCGDIFGYFYDQLQIIDKLREKNVICIKGNHDDLIVKAQRDSKLRDDLIKKYGSSYKINLSNETLQWIDSRPLIYEIYEPQHMIFVHGTVDNPLNGRIYPDTEIMTSSKIESYTLIFMSHTHYRMYREVNRVYYINPGSLGQPRDKKGCSYIVFDPEINKVEFCSVHIEKKKLLDNVKNEWEGSHNKSYLLKKLEEM